MTTRNELILFRIAKYQRVAVIDYPNVLTNTESYTDIKLKLQCLVNEWAPANYTTIQFIPTDYRDFDSRFEHITARVGRFFEFDESVSFLIEYSERLYENEYSCKQSILVTYSFEKDEKFQRIDTKFSSIPTNAEPDEITPDAVIFKDKQKTAYDQRTGRQLCQARPEMLLTHQGIPIELHYVVNDTTFAGNNRIFRMEGNTPECIFGDSENLTYRDGGSDLCLFVHTEAIGSHDPDDYVCVEFLADGQLDFIPLYKFSREDVELEYNEDIKPGSYLCCGDYFYNIGENCLLSEKDIIEKTRNDYYDDDPDDYDYYRDTYYALGGDDYDALRRNGVDPGDAIDSLMDYQGY